MKLLITSTFLILIALSGCEKRKEIILQGGYKPVRLYGDAHSILKPNGKELIMPNVVYAVDNESFLVGLRQRAKPELKLPSGVDDQLYGYFIYDKKTNNLTMGLTVEELRSLSMEKNINLEFE